MNKFNEIMNLKTWLLFFSNIIFFYLLFSESTLIRSFLYEDKGILALIAFLFFIWFIFLIPSLITFLFVFIDIFFDFFEEKEENEQLEENRKKIINDNNECLSVSLISIILLFLTFSYYHDKEIPINTYKEFYKDVKEDELMKTAYKSFKQDVPITYGYLEQILDKYKELKQEQKEKQIQEVKQEEQLSKMSEKNKVLKQLKQIHNS